MAGPTFDQLHLGPISGLEAWDLYDLLCSPLQLVSRGRCSMSSSDPADRVETSRIGSAAKAEAGGTEERPIPSLERP